MGPGGMTPAGVGMELAAAMAMGPLWLALLLVECTPAPARELDPPFPMTPPAPISGAACGAAGAAANACCSALAWLLSMLAVREKGLPGSACETGLWGCVLLWLRWQNKGGANGEADSCSSCSVRPEKLCWWCRMVRGTAIAGDVASAAVLLDRRLWTAGACSEVRKANGEDRWGATCTGLPGVPADAWPSGMEALPPTEGRECSVLPRISWGCEGVEGSNWVGVGGADASMRGSK
eukprot:1159922-Pelagomonas_calceolata.AAC.5